MSRVLITTCDHDFIEQAITISVNGEVHKVSVREETCDKMLDNWFSKNKVLARKSLSPQSTDSDVGSEGVDLNKQNNCDNFDSVVF